MSRGTRTVFVKNSSIAGLDPGVNKIEADDDSPLIIRSRHRLRMFCRTDLSLGWTFAQSSLMYVLKIVSDAYS